MTLHRIVRRLIPALGAVCLFAAVSSSAAAAPSKMTDVFTGVATVAPGQTSPIQINPGVVDLRRDGAIGLGYTYLATGTASGQLPGKFTYEEHGFLYFKNPSDPTTMVGSRFVSGVFTVTPARGGVPVQIADTAPEAYTSGVQTGVSKLPPAVRAALGKLGPNFAAFTYGYFTFTTSEGTYTGYATPDFTRFGIQISFPVN